MKKNATKLFEYKGSHEVVTAHDTKLLVAHIDKTIVSLNSCVNIMLLQNVYRVHCMKKNLLLLAQLTYLGHSILFGLQDVRIYCDYEVKKEPMITG